MERLTRKDKKKEFYYIPNKCLRMDGDRYYGEDDGFFDMLKRLAEFEDFMEEQGFEDLNTFRTAIKLNQLMNKAGVEHFKENQELKARWEKLKDFINTFKEHNIDEANLAWNILDKMRELEKNQLIDDMAKALVDAKRGRKNADKPF